MFRRIVVFAVLLATNQPSRGASRQEEARLALRVAQSQMAGTIVDCTANHDGDCRFYSESLKAKRDMYLYLPPGFTPKNRYPFAIFLHGLMQDEQKILKLLPMIDRAIIEGKLPPVIVAAPDGTLHGHHHGMKGGSFYVNSQSGAYSDYIAYDVWNYVVTRYPIRPEPEAHILVGVSMGGYGAYNLGIKYRDRFKNIVGVLPGLNPRYMGADGRYSTDFDPSCQRMMEKYRPHAVIGRFYMFWTVRNSTIIDPLYGRDRDYVLRQISKENPTEMLETCNVKPGELNMFIGYAERDELNLDAHAESFVYMANKRGIYPTVVKIPNGKHNGESARKVFPAFAEWIKERVAPYAPPLHAQPAIPTIPPELLPR